MQARAFFAENRIQIHAGLTLVCRDWALFAVAVVIL
jgi:hypothetical protein